jgi:hypothetical protein
MWGNNSNYRTALLIAIAMGMFLWITQSCAPKHLSEDQLKQYILEPDNELVKEAVVEDYKIRVAYRPTDLLIAQELGTSQDIARINALRTKYSNQYYFILSLSKNDREAIQAGIMPQAQFSELLQTISFRMGAYVTMTTAARDTIPLTDYAYNRTFGMGSSNDILLVFKKEKMTGDWLQINLAEFGLGVGRQSLRFMRKKLDNVPKIDFNSSI